MPCGASRPLRRSIAIALTLKLLVRIPHDLLCLRAPVLTISGGKRRSAHPGPDADGEARSEMRRRILHAATEEVAHELLIDVAGHPKGAPSEKELVWANPDVSRRTITRRLDDLVDTDVLERHTYERGEQPADADSNVRTFYRITDRARAVFDEVGLFDPAVWQPVYARVEKPDEIEAAEAVPRP